VSRAISSRILSSSPRDADVPDSYSVKEKIVTSFTVYVYHTETCVPMTDRVTLSFLSGDQGEYASAHLGDP